jgi:hypothetical protein
VLKDHGVKLVEAEIPSGNVFGSKLKNVNPGTYKLSGKPFFIYEFENEDDLEKGIREFDKKTATMEIVSSSMFEKRNVLIFYVHEQDFDTESMPFEKDIQGALDSISEG